MGKRSSKSGLFLIELILILLFFSFSSAVCLQLFARAHLKDKESVSLTMAVTQAQNAAEGFYTSCMSAKDLLKLFPGSSLDGDSLVTWYNKDWQTCGKDEAKYVRETAFSSSGRQLTASIDIRSLEDREASLYKLKVNKYIREGSETSHE